jgi:putative transposase
MSHVATTAGIKGDDIRDLMVTTVKQRFGRHNRLRTTMSA